MLKNKITVKGAELKKILGREAISLHRLRQSFMAFMESRSFAH